MSADRPQVKSALRSVNSPNKLTEPPPGRQLLNQLLGDIASGTVRLPSPDHRIAKRIQRGISQAAHGRRVARLLSADPSLSAKALRAACGSAQLRRPRSLIQAVEHLDRHYISGLVAAATEAGAPYEDRPVLRQTARALWQRAMRVSAISYLLASLDGRFDPEEAALAGLLHNLGDLALLSRASQNEQATMENHLADACRLYGAKAGAELARSWGFPASLIRVAASHGDWSRDHDGPADMADLCLVAQLHACLGQTPAVKLPKLHAMPAFKRLDLGQVTPRFSLDLMEAANSALALTQRQLSKL